MGAKKKSPKQQPKTYEDFLAVEHQQWAIHKEQERPNIPEPTYPFKIGEVVVYGALLECKIIEVLDNGKILHLSYHDKGQIYGQRYDAGHKPRLVWWVDCDPLALETNTAFARPRIFTSYSQTSLDSLIHTAYHRGLIDNPYYQREYVWTLHDKQKLVRSIFNRADIGKFLFIEDDSYKEYRLEVVDGKQRLRAILDFYEGRFPFEGKTWFELSGHDKSMFGDLRIQTATIQQNCVKKSDVLWLFLQLNVGGVPQTEEHIAKAQKLYEQALKDERKGS